MTILGKRRFPKSGLFWEGHAWAPRGEILGRGGSAGLKTLKKTIPGSFGPVRNWELLGQTGLGWEGP